MQATHDRQAGRETRSVHAHLDPTRPRLGVLRNMHLQHTVPRVGADAGSNADNAYLRDRAADIRDLRVRLMLHIATNGSAGLRQLAPDSILIARELLPSDPLEFNRECNRRRNRPCRRSRMRARRSSP